MSTSVIPGEWVTLRDEASVAVEAASRAGKALRDAIAQRGSASLALSGGNTPRPAYERLANEPGIHWDKVSIFWIDERAVAPTHARSNYRLAKESLLDRAPIPAGNVHRMVGEGSDLEQAARDYEEVLRKHLGVSNTFGQQARSFDVAVLGIGDDGHTASLFPGEASVEVRDRVVLAIGAAPEKGREARLTVTAPVLEGIGTALVLAIGKVKHAPLERVRKAEGSLRETPSRVLRNVSGSVYWLIDEAAGGFK